MEEGIGFWDCIALSKMAFHDFLSCSTVITAISVWSWSSLSFSLLCNLFLLFMRFAVDVVVCRENMAVVIVLFVLYTVTTDHLLGYYSLSTLPYFCPFPHSSFPENPHFPFSYSTKFYFIFFFLSLLLLLLLLLYLSNASFCSRKIVIRVKIITSWLRYFRD